MQVDLESDFYFLSQLTILLIARHIPVGIYAVKQYDQGYPIYFYSQSCHIYHHTQWEQLSQNPITALLFYPCYQLSTQKLLHHVFSLSGYGSCLNIKGEVECDASLMTSDGYFGAVSSISGIKNPIIIAEDLLKQQHHPPGDGRIPPR